MGVQDHIDFCAHTAVRTPRLPQARAGIDAFPAVDYGDYADPAALLGAFVPGGSGNWDNFNSGAARLPRWVSRTTSTS